MAARPSEMRLAAASVRPAPQIGRVLERLMATPSRATRATHVEQIPARLPRRAPWPGWLDERVIAAYARLGIVSPWAHQAEAAELAYAGRSVVVATGTASGKSLAYQLPVLQALVSAGVRAGCDSSSAALNLIPSTALNLIPPTA
ncbi:MAG: DEAD/DEAH box helicase, partial [Acidothermaceae bacterium]